ncbi:hypothetical protein IBE48_09475 [Francisella philomiragia]|uniref:Glycosyl transferase 2 family protein n=1 Tax=Francisella philomiragia TaxID=28110 RepID=A0AAW3D8X3_9GAMM|nr:hypothetical protein [Francisella philomiragia]KFJ42065.1 hypothetical protein DR78_431 [Francisella philomiragia]MBK2255669.1 hypothetical protein [Francisella philomiragia]MBK2273992.1 hypothetical protein [Francisella philomiragia]MBK2277833.1 hypothetical protein [Francisella philomiragia]MBK2281779.1 hypothetical protein [Francisella philomiragia]
MIVILIVIYDQKVEDSATISSLLDIDLDLSQCRLVIWNNGSKIIDKKIQHTEKFYSVDFFETLENISLAKIYNRVIELYDCQKYIILDHDSTLSREYMIDTLKLESDCVGFPIINGISPFVNRKNINQKGSCKADDKVLAIGSGMVLSKYAINSVLQVYSSIFDERFYLYGVDTSFCLRLIKSFEIVKIRIINGFEHSSSLLIDEPQEIKKFRKKERTYASALICRYYYSKKYTVFFFIKNSVFNLAKIIFNKSTSLYMSKFLYAYFLGKHYRDKS